MRKIAFILAVVLVLLSFSACGAGDASTQTTTAEEQTTKKAEENVVISVRKDLVADEAEFLTGISEIEGITSTADDVFYKLEMSQEAYKKLLEVKSQDVLKFFDDTQKNNSFIEDVQHSEDFRRITLFVNREKYDEFNDDTKRLHLISFGAMAMSYQMFLTEGQKVYVSAIYSDTEEVAMEVALPVEM